MVTAVTVKNALIYFWFSVNEIHTPRVFYIGKVLVTL